MSDLKKAMNSQTAPPCAESCASPPEPELWRLRTRPRHVLVVDDSVINQKVAKGLLSVLGCGCEIVDSGIDALKALERQHFDLALMDIQMPTLSGIEAARIIRSCGELWSEIPIVALTANAQRDDIETYLAAGMDACLSKPLDREALSATLKSLPRRSRLLKMNLDNESKQPESGKQSLIIEDSLAQSINDMGRDWLVKILPTVIEKMDESILALEDMAAESDWLQIEKTAHSLKGSSAQFGFGFLNELSRKIERACKAGLTDDALEGMSRIGSVWSATKEELRQRKLL